MTESPVVKVEQGLLQGKIANSPNGKAYYSFQGIPYAKPPIGSLRFRDPQLPESWEGIREATVEGNEAPQINEIFGKPYTGDENCLFLNIYTPSIDGEFLPVMFFVHGGAFKFGSGNSDFYGGDYLVEKDVVVVTINYRLGPLGFLCLNTPEVPGNAGMKDMVQALRWVRQNIGRFGGNSKNITIFGESAGGACTSYCTASPLSKNLISKAILQSGTALNAWGFQKCPIENATKLAQELGCKSSKVNDILDFLTTTPVKDVIETAIKLSSFENVFETNVNMFTPVVEMEFPGVESFITEPFINIITSGRTADIPIMIGTTTLEFPYHKKTNDLQMYIPNDLQIEKNTEDSLAFVENLKRLYFKGEPSSEENLINKFHLFSDSFMNVDTHRYIQYLIKSTNKPIYYYKFDYVGELNMSKNIVKDATLEFAGHADELGYLFSTEYQKNVEETPQDVKMRERMLRLWTNFAKTGIPTPEENHYLPITWLPVTKDNLYYLNLSNELSLRSNPDQEKMAFWESLYNKYYKTWENFVENKQFEVSTTPVIIKETIKTTSLVNGEEVTQIENIDNLQKIANNKLIIGDHGVNVVENANVDRKPRPSNEIKLVQGINVDYKDVIRAHDPPEDDLPKNIGVNKFVNFYESLGGKKAPQPPESWEGIREATAEGNEAPQIDEILGKPYTGDENCLFLNIYSPSIDGKSPVMLFIHGGAFKQGSGNFNLYGGDCLVEKDVVVVTINYRLGPLGFLCLNTPEIPGNAGLKDMVQALRWVRQNIGSFGGNSENITIFGESAGGASTSYCTASPLSKNLISKAILESGTALHSWGLQKYPIENATKLAQELGCKSSEVNDILEFLTKTPAKNIIEGSIKLFSLLTADDNDFNSFTPVVEIEFPGVEAFITEPFINILTSGRTADIPIMIGSTTLEFLMDKKTNDLQMYIPNELNLEKNSEESLAIAEKLKYLYFKGDPSSKENLINKFHLGSDVVMNVDIHRYIQYLIKSTNKPIYYYKFDYVGELNMSKNIVKDVTVEYAGHMDELGYLFSTEYQKNVEETPQDVKMRERMLRLWTNFAKTGNPTPEENHYLPITWLPVTKDNLFYLNLSNELSLRSNPDQEKLAFWESLYNKYYKTWENFVENKQFEVSTTPVIIKETIKTTSLVNGEEVTQIENIDNLQKIANNKLIIGDQGVNVVENANVDRKLRPSNEIKLVQEINVDHKDVIRAHDPPEDDLPKNIGVNKFVNFYESLGGKK